MIEITDEYKAYRRICSRLWEMEERARRIVIDRLLKNMDEEIQKHADPNS